jgi:hypothetical protein
VILFFRGSLVDDNMISEAETLLKMDFIYPPADVSAYLKGLIQGRPKHYISHIPDRPSYLRCPGVQLCTQGKSDSGNDHRKQKDSMRLAAPLILTAGQSPLIWCQYRSLQMIRRTLP